MRKILFTCLVTLLLHFSPTYCAGPLTFDFEPAFNSKYLWRGITCSGAPVLQPSLSASYGQLSFNLWGNLNLESNNDYDFELNEVDYTLCYQYSTGPVDFSLGSILYTFPNIGDGSTAELFAGVGFPMLLNSSVTLYQDVDEAEGTYVSLAVAPSIPLDNWNTSLDISLSVGFGSSKHNAFYYGSSGGGATDILVGFGMPFKLSGRTAITPQIAFTGLLDKSIRDIQADDSAILLGVSVSTSF